MARGFRFLDEKNTWICRAGTFTVKAEKNTANAEKKAVNAGNKKADALASKVSIFREDGSVKEVSEYIDELRERAMSSTEEA